ncbi:MAG: VOC family protein [Candidatus Dormibacteria bacterium]
MPSVSSCLWFDHQALEAAEFYVSVFPNSRIKGVSHYGEAGPGAAGSVLTVGFELDGTEFLALNGGPLFTFSEAVSFVVRCSGQAEIDHYWDRLVEGGEESQCGWLKDRFGLSWQVVPKMFELLMSDADQGRRDRAMAAVLQMRKLDLQAILAAADG